MPKRQFPLLQNILPQTIDHPQQKGVASDIIQEAEKGYDIVAMGRTANSGIKEFLMGGTTIMAIVTTLVTPISLRLLLEKDKNR